MNLNISNLKITDLSASKVEELKCVFDRFDVDGDGMITYSELGIVCESMGLSTLSKRELKRMIRRIDLDGSGEIDFEEFITVMTSPQIGLSEEKELEQTFKVFDRNSKGYIAPEDLCMVLNQFGMDGARVTVDDIVEMLSDAGLEDWLCFSDFESLLSSAENSPSSGLC
jgi:Ca2+-binding EF-hand superfamily protein